MVTDRPDNELLDWLREADQNAIPDRLVRLKYVHNVYPIEQGTFLFGGPVVSVALHEMQLSYIFGLDLACVLTAQVVLEHLLDGLLGFDGSSDHDDSGLKVLAQQALDRGYISDLEYANIESLRRIRNPYVHARPMMADGCLIRRTAEANIPMENVIEQDAQLALTTVIGILIRPPFSLPTDPSSLH